MKFSKTSLKLSAFAIAGLGFILTTHEALSSAQISLQRRGISTDQATAVKMLTNQSLIADYQQHAKPAGMTAEEFVKEKEAHPAESAANIVANHQIGGALAHAGIAVVDDKNKKAAKHLQDLHQGLTPELVKATVELQETLHIALPTLEQIKAAEYLQGAPLHIANPTLDEIKAEEYLQSLKLNAPSGDILETIVYLQTDPLKHLGGAIAAPTEEELEAAAHLWIGLVKKDFDLAQLKATEYLRAAPIGIAAPTLAQINATLDLRAPAGPNNVGSPPLAAPTHIAIDALISHAGKEGVKYLRWAIRSGFGGQPAGTVPHSLTKIVNVINAGTANEELECQNIWNDPAHAAPVAVGARFKIMSAPLAIASKAKGKYFVFEGLKDDGVHAGFKTVDHAGQP